MFAQLFHWVQCRVCISASKSLGKPTYFVQRYCVLFPYRHFLHVWVLKVKTERLKHHIQAKQKKKHNFQSKFEATIASNNSKSEPEQNQEL